MRFIAFVLLVLAIAGLSFSVDVGACQLINASGSYVLTANPTGSPINPSPFFGGACIKINSSNVVFDCAGHSMSNGSTGSGDTYGVLLNGSLTNVTVKNCVIFNYTYGIYEYQSSNSFILNNSINKTNHDDIHFDSSNSNTLSNNSVYNAGFYGIYLDTSSNNNTLINNTASNNPTGIYIYFANSNNLSGNTASNNDYGIRLVSSNNSALSSNIASNNSAGIFLDSSNNNSLYNNSAYNNNGGIQLTSSSNNNTLSKNNATGNAVDGISIGSSNNNTLTNNTANNNGYGFEIGLSIQNTLYNNTAMENSILDLIVTPGSPAHCQNTIMNTTGSANRPIYYSNQSVSWNGLNAAEIELCGASGSNVTNTRVNGSDTLYNDAFLIFLSNSTNITNTSSSGNNVGFVITSSYGGTFRNDFANNNNGSGLGDSGSGFSIDSDSGSNTFQNITANGNGVTGFIVNSNSNTFKNNTANGNAGIGFSVMSNSNIFQNNTANGNTEAGFSIDSGSASNTFQNNNASSSINGFEITGTSNTAQSNIANNNSGAGFLVEDTLNNLSNNIAYNNTDGFDITGYFNGEDDYYPTNLSNLTDNLAANNTANGFYVNLASNNVFSNNNATGNGYGFNITSSNDTLLSGTHFYKNSYDFGINSSYDIPDDVSFGPSNYTMVNSIFDNPTGSMENFTNLSINDSVPETESYTINWTRNSSSLPAGNVSFAQTFVNISTLTAPVSITSIVWSWTATEASGYTPASFALYKYNSTWTMLNNTPDTVGDTLSISNLNPGSIYGILQNGVANCPIISSSGSYVQTANFTGSPNNVGGNLVCLEIDASNVTYDCNGSSMTGNDSGITYGVSIISVSNVTLKNCVISNYTTGVYAFSTNYDKIINNSVTDITTGFDFSSDSNISLTNNSVNNSVYGFSMGGDTNLTLSGNKAFNSSQSGFSVGGNSNLLLIGNTATLAVDGFSIGANSNANITNNNESDSGEGFLIISGNTNTTLSNNIAFNNTGRGFYFLTGFDTTLINNTAYQNDLGYYLIEVSNNTLINNTAFNNTQQGFFLFASPNNTLANNTAQENQYDLMVGGTNASSCANSILNTTGSGGRPILYENSTVNLNGVVASEILLCNADNSVITNSMVNGSSLIANNGFIMYYTNNATISGTTSADNAVGFMINSDTNITLTNDTAYGTNTGFNLGASSGLMLTNSTAYNTSDGILLSSAHNTTLINNTAYNNSDAGIISYYSDNLTIIGNVLHDNGNYGVYLYAPNVAIISRDHIYNGNFQINDFGGSSISLNMTNEIFDSPSGGFQNFTNLSINDTLAVGESYSINWTRNESALPSGNISFLEKFVNISTAAGTPSIDTIVWSWTATEASGYTPASFALWKYNSSNWTNLNGTPDTVANTLSLFNLVPGSDYGILETLNGCQVINAPGSYTLTSNVTGNDVYPYGSIGGTACILINNTANVTLDCAGYTVSSIGTSAYPTHVAIQNSTNVTVKNCILNLSNVSIGLAIYNSSYSMIRNNSASGNNANAPFEFSDDDTAFYSSFINNSASYTTGFAYATGTYATYANNTAMNLEGSVFNYLGHNSTVTGNTIINCSLPFAIDPIGDWSNFTNNVVINSGLGFFLEGQHNRVIGNNVTNCSGIGFNVQEGNYNTLQNNIASNNSGAGYLVFNGISNNLSNNIAYNDTAGFRVEGESPPFAILNNLTNNTAANNSGNGFYVEFGQGNSFLNNNANGNGYGFYISDSTDTVLSGTSFYNNSHDFTISNPASSSNYTMINSIFGNPSGSMANHTNLSINDTVPIAEAYTINWTLNPGSIQLGKASFAQKFVNISTLSGTVSIDSISWGWTDSEVSLGGYNESRFQLWKFNSTWTDLNSTPNTAADTLSLTNMNPASDYGILQDNDTTAPKVYLNSPAPSAIFNITNVTFNFTATDDVSTTMNCSIYIDNILNSTNPSTANNTPTLFPITGIPAGAHSWNVSCTDGSGNTGANTSRNFTIDLTAPSVSIQRPQNISYNITSGLPLNFTVSDNVAIDSCWYKLDSGSSVFGCTNTTFSAGAGGHNMSVYTNDTAGNTASASVIFTVDTTAPSITLQRPQNISYNITSGLPLNFTVSDNVAIDSCWYKLDSGSSVFGCTNTTFSAGAGGHNMSVYTNDTAGNTASASVIFTVDTTGPTISLQRPQNISYNITTGLPLNFTVSDNVAIDSCWYKLDSGSSVLGCTNTTFSAGAGGHNMSVYTNDTAGNTASASVIFTVDTTGPTISLQRPQNISYNITTGLPLNFTVSDNVAIDSCWYKLDGGSSVFGCTNTTFSAADGIHNMSVYTNDTAGNTASASVIFKVDTTQPVIQLSSPGAGETVTTSTVSFRFTAVDNLSATMNCSLYLDNKLNATNPATANNTPTTFNVLNVIDGTHNWSVSCTDSASNTGVSAVRDFIVDTTTHHEQQPAPLPTLSVSLDSKCAGNVVTVMSGSTEIEGADVLVDNANNLADIASGTSDSNGQLNFSGCDLKVRIRAAKDGYQTIEVTKQVIACEQCVECVSDNNCPDNKQCINEKCVALECGCGHAVNHECVSYQCCNDNECSTGQTCQSHTCTVPEKKYECTSDSDCSGDKSCSIPTGEKGGSCVEITGCGVVANHVLTPFQCGSDPNCPSCGYGQVCISNTCKTFDLKGPASGFIGDNANVQAREDNGTCAGCDLRITDPTGKTITGKTDSSGNFVLPLKTTGIYKVAYLKNGIVVKTVEIQSLPKASTPGGETPPTITAGAIAAGALWMLVILGLIVAAILLMRRRKGGDVKGSKRPKE